MVFKYFKLTISLILLHTACSERGVNQVACDNKYSSEINSKASNIIDSNGIANFSVCDKIEKNNLLQKYLIDIDTISYEEDSWLAYYLFEDSLKKRWVLIESTEVDSDQIGKLSTNSSSYITKEGIKVGDKLLDLTQGKKKFEIRIEEGEVYLYLFNSSSSLYFNNLLNVTFETFEAAYYDPEKNNKRKLLEMLNKNGIISEISIISYCK